MIILIVINIQRIAATISRTDTWLLYSSNSTILQTHFDASWMKRRVGQNLCHDPSCEPTRGLIMLLNDRYSCANNEIMIVAILVVLMILVVMAVSIMTTTTLMLLLSSVIVVAV